MNDSGGEAQFVYGLEGWVDLEFELLEVTLPADMGTAPCERPPHLG